MTRKPRNEQNAGPWIQEYPATTLALLVVLCLIPFVGKAFHIDDPLFIWAARHIQENPANPYGFNVNWYGTEMPMSDVTKNPPGASYYLALVGSLFGYGEIALHLAFLLPAMAVIVGTFLIARRLCDQPVVASLCALFTPVFLVSSTSVMSDAMMLAFWVFAVHFWLTGLEQESHVHLLLASILVAFSALTKYFGIALIPLLLLYALVKRRRVGTWALFMFIPVVALGGYQWVTDNLYGRGLLLDAASYATAIPSQFGKVSIPQILVGLAFTGGCIVIVIPFARLIWPTKVLLAGAFTTASLVWLIYSSKSIGSYALPTEPGARLSLAIHFGLFIMSGISLAAISLGDFLHHKSAESALLVAWISGTFVFAAFINWTINGRSILPMVPAAGILVVRRMQLMKREAKGTRTRLVWMPLAASAAIALSVTWGDYAHAESAREAADTIRGRYVEKGFTVWFQGHWGFQYYMEREGGRSIDVQKSRLRPSDLIVSPENNTNLASLPEDFARVLTIVEVPASGWVTAMQPEKGAGFWAAVWGPIPFVLGEVPPERYEILEVAPRRRR